MAGNRQCGALAMAAFLALALLPTVSAAPAESNECADLGWPDTGVQGPVLPEDVLLEFRWSSSAFGNGGDVTCLDIPSGDCPDGHYCGECTGQVVTIGGPLVCNLQNQFLCEQDYDEDCSDGYRTCRGGDGTVRQDYDQDRDGQCDSDGDVDDDDDGVPDRCDEHSDNQDLVQELVDYAKYYLIDEGYCPEDGS